MVVVVAATGAIIMGIVIITAKVKIAAAPLMIYVLLFLSLIDIILVPSTNASNKRLSRGNQRTTEQKVLMEKETLYIYG
jgi:hypothetical protein